MMNEQPSSPTVTPEWALHLMDLRGRVLRCVLLFLVFFAVFYFLKEKLLAFLVIPLTQAGVENVLALGVTELFFAYIRVAGWAAFLLMLPVFFLEVWLFIRPGLFASERAWVGSCLLAVIPLFYAGMALAYSSILPLALDFFIGFQQQGVLALPALGAYLDFMLLMMLVCGIAFNLPLFLILLVRVGVVPLEKLVAARRWVLVAILLGAAMLTPPDPFSLFLLAIPLYGLFEITILLMRWKWL